MVKICKVPSHVRHHFTANELSAWSDDVRYSYQPEEKIREREEMPSAPRPPIQRISSGIKLV